MTPAPARSPAEQNLKLRLTQNPGDMEARRKLARTYLVEGRTQEAAEQYSHILQKNQRDGEALNYLAFYHLERGAFEHAFPLFQGLLIVNPHNKAAQYQLQALIAFQEKGRAAAKFSQLFERIIHETDQSLSLGLRREQIPCLIEMNGDLLWMPGDLLRFLWHTVRKPVTSYMPSFFAETDHYAWIRERITPGDMVLDIGSNIGIFATMMGARVGPKGRVYAFEPSAQIASDLRRVLALNELSHVTVIEAAVSNRAGEATFCDVKEEDVRRESSHLEDLALERGPKDLKKNATVVKTLAIDDFVAEHDVRPAVMKIDVEGAEFLVLEGAQKTIGTYKPKLVIEIHPDNDGVFDHERLTEHFKRFGYQYKLETKTYYCWQGPAA